MFWLIHIIIILTPQHGSHGDPLTSYFGETLDIVLAVLDAEGTLHELYLDARNAAKAQETRQHFSENKERSIALLRKAISTLEEEIADAEPVVVAVQKPEATPVIEAVQALKPEVRALQHRRWGGIALAATWRRVGRWWRGRN